MYVDLRVVGTSAESSRQVMQQSIPFTVQKLLIGRESDCHFRPDSALVSRSHCVIMKDEHSIRIRDLGSRNGTFVNGQKIEGFIFLKDRDTIIVGDIMLRIGISHAAAGDQIVDNTKHTSQETQTLTADQTGTIDSDTALADDPYPPAFEDMPPLEEVDHRPDSGE